LVFKNDEKFEKRGITKFIVAKPSDKTNQETKQNRRKRLVSYGNEHLGKYILNNRPTLK